MINNQKLQHVPRWRTAVFAGKGHHRVAILDIARARDMSLSGLPCQPFQRRLAEAGR